MLNILEKTVLNDDQRNRLAQFLVQKSRDGTVPSVMFVCGKTGAGKSAVCRTIHKHFLALQESDQVPHKVFWLKDRIGHDSIVCTSLTACTPSEESTVENSLLHFSGVRFKPHYVTSYAKCIQMLNDKIDTSIGHQLVVIDDPLSGLACDETARPLLMAFCHEIASWNEQRVKVIVTSQVDNTHQLAGKRVEVIRAFCTRDENGVEPDQYHLAFRQNDGQETLIY